MKITVNSLDVSDIKEFDKIFSGVSELRNVLPQRSLVLKEIKNADAYLASAAIKVDKEFLNNAPNLKVIGSPSTGVDHLDLNMIRKKKITCFDISKEFKLINSFTATSELAFGLLLNLNRRIIPAAIKAKKGFWERDKYQGFQLINKTIGIIGLGRLGKITAKIALGFGMKVIANDVRNIKSTKNIKMVSLLDIARLSDVVAIHVHLNKNTEGLINNTFFNNMKTTATIINTARGKIIKEKALLDALLNKKIAGAGLDVIDGEWLNKKEREKHPLIKFAKKNDNLLITPHIGGSTIESVQHSRIFMAKKIVSFLNNSSKKE